MSEPVIGQPGPMFTPVTGITCPICHRVFSTRFPNDVPHEWIPRFLRMITCNDCSDRREANYQANRRAAAERAKSLVNKPQQYERDKTHYEARSASYSRHPGYPDAG